MIFQSEYKFTVPVGDRFREAGYRDLFFRLLTNKLTEQCARSLHQEGTSLDFKTSALIGRTWFKSGRIDLRTDERPIAIECALSVRRLVLLYPVAGCVFVIVSLVSRDMMSLASTIPTALLYFGIWAMGIWGTIRRFKEMIQQQIAAADSACSLG